MTTDPATADRHAFAVGDYVEKIGGDYEFLGRVVSVFRKFCRHDFREGVPTGPARCVVQNIDGVVHIFNESQIKKRFGP